MNKSDATLRVNPQTGEIEIHGSEKFVREMLDYVRPIIEGHRRPQGRPRQEEKAPPVKAQVAGKKPASPDMPEEFGEYRHRFSATHGTDQVLIAGRFAQEQSESNSFKTNEATKLLQDQSIKLTNPSQAVKQGLKSKRLIKLRGGKYRVSQSGIAAIDKLAGSEE